MKEFKGTFVVTITPFTQDDILDEEGLRSNIDWYIKEGIHGIACTGSTGEFVALTEHERKRIVEITIEQVNNRVPVLVGTCGCTTKDTIKWSKYARDAGADGIMIVHPYYHRPDDDELYEHYKKIAQAVDIPIMLYNNPFTTGVDASPELVARLAKEFDNISYVKESSGSIQRVQDIIRLAGDDMTVFCGDDTLAFESFVLGARGWIAASANPIPKKCAQLFELVEKGNITEARNLWFNILPLTNAVEGWGKFVQTNKKGLDLLGKAGGPSLRGPKLDLTKEQETELRKMLSDLGEL